MNHQRFGWREDERPEAGRGSGERGRNPRYRGPSDFGGRNEDYDDMGYSRTSGSGGYNEDYYRGQEYGPRHFGGEGSYYGGMQSDERERDRYGRFTSESQGRGYGRGMHSMDRDRDDYGRFTSEGGYGRGYGRGMHSMDRDRDEYGRFVSEGGHSRGYGRGMHSMDRDRDEYGRFVSEGDGDSHQRGMQGLRMMRDDQGRFTGQRSGGYGRNVGRHTGRGPKNYQRSDDRIKEEVSDRLEQDGDIDASELEVKVQNGVVTLTGSVETRDEKHMAEELAEECSGVKDVQNQLKVTGRQGEHGKMGSSQHTGTQNEQKEHGRKTA